jgi:hypothetical protein
MISAAMIGNACGLMLSSLTPQSMAGAFNRPPRLRARKDGEHVIACRGMERCITAKTW